MTSAAPVIEGWFSADPEPHLIGLRCGACGTIAFPPEAIGCPNPACSSDDLETVPLSRRGTVWSFATNHYAAPEPYVSPDPFEPYTVVAVELTAERMIVLGQLSGDPDGLEIGDTVEVVIEPLQGDDALVWKWARA